jgi:hypothetical protein
MPTLPDKFTEILMMFAVHFRPQAWRYARVLVIGTILARGRRTMCAVLWVMGLSDHSRFVKASGLR